jgi:hypothetical protein
MSDAEKSWAFRFSLEAQNGSRVLYSQAEELIDVIIEWVEARDLQIDGGVRRGVKLDTMKIKFPRVD